MYIIVLQEVYPSRYFPGDGLDDHLAFALKYDGTNLSILYCLFQKAPEEEIITNVTSKPTGKYTRRLWFLYEFLTGKTLMEYPFQRAHPDTVTKTS
ncbi:hypothetical protein JW926_15985 [Candidatus Sumerlaeota bacterium]|nr:hypothetical protein [Candidatus Sumerlaeota bacterium]